MAAQDQLEIQSLSKELTALKLASQGRSTPDARITKRIAALEDLIGRKKTATLSTPNATYKKGGMVKKQQAKVKKVLGEFKEGKLHSGKNGKVVKDKGQAIAIALSVARKKK
jgi:ribosomal protein L21E